MRWYFVLFLSLQCFLYAEAIKPIPEQIHALSVVSGMVHGDEISLAVAVDWLEASTNRKLSRMGLKKHIDKNYNGREEELKNKFNSILDKF
jgi:hypothetical protein